MTSLFQYQDIAKNLTNGQFAQNIKTGSDIYEHVHLIKHFLFQQQVMNKNNKNL